MCIRDSLKRTQGGNPETTLGRFQSFVNEAEGFARKARYYAEFQLPQGVTNQTLGNAEELQGFSQDSDNKFAQDSNGRRVRAFCNAIQMPDREIVMKEVKHNGPARNIAYDFKSCLLYTSPSPRDRTRSRMPSSA